MKQVAFLIMMLFVTKTYSAKLEIEELKTLFEAAAYSKASADRFLKLLSTVDHSSTPILICYKGVAEMMQAKYGFNPISKLRRFKKGKTLIDEAVKKQPDNLEIRFLRLAIQTNLPAFLNYSDNIIEDEKYLLANIQTIKNKNLKQDILKYLLASKHCSAEEKKELAI
jgi:hypothetical protein